MTIPRVYVDSFEDEDESPATITKPRSIKPYWYFAYGSNMNAKRMKERGMNWKCRTGSILYDWELVFNKCSTKAGGTRIGWANIRQERGAAVEGVAYLITTPLVFLDRFEPGYQREVISLELDNGDDVKAVAYVAKGAWTGKHLYPPDWYMDHLLCGKNFLSEEYYAMLASHPVLTYTVTRRK